MELSDRRRGLVAVVAHCILNQNTVVKPLASHEGTVKELVKTLVEYGYGIVQLPCPEAIYLGLKRWWMSREQYNTESYREFSRRVLEPVVKLLTELARDGCKYIVLGVRGSPSCAVEVTSSNPRWCGEPRVQEGTVKVRGLGVFMEELFKMLKEKELPEPLLAVDIDHREIAERGLSRELVKHLYTLSTMS